MARITVEDCLEHVDNRFQLVMLASKRARQLMRGSVEPTVPWENDKATVVALREIANGHTDFSDAHQIDVMAITPQPKPANTEEDIEDIMMDDGIIIEDIHEESTSSGHEEESEE